MKSLNSLEYGDNTGKRKGQGALEFLIVIGAAVFLFAILMIIVYNNVSEVNREKERRIIENIALSVQDEISLAVKSTDGYYREFSIPEKIGSQDYSINITGSRIYIETEKNAVSYLVKEAEGSIKKGLNLIKKENGRVYLN